MKQDKYKRKIRKLLALAQSDNPNEAERARVQAEKMMKQHLVTTDELEVITKASTVPVQRKKLKASENILISAIKKISGTHPLISIHSKYKKGWKSKSTIQFMGIQYNAELACYTWDVLYDQLKRKQRDLKKQYPGIKADQVERYSRAWVFTAADKLVNVFGSMDIPENVNSNHEKVIKDLKPAESIEDKPMESDAKKALDALGYQDGLKAKLNIAAGDQSTKQMLLS